MCIPQLLILTVSLVVRALVPQTVTYMTLLLVAFTSDTWSAVPEELGVSPATPITSTLRPAAVLLPTAVNHVLVTVVVLTIMKVESASALVAGRVLLTVMASVLALKRFNPASSTLSFAHLPIVVFLRV